MKPSWKKDYVRYRSFFLNVMATYKRRADLKVYLEVFLSLATISIFSVFALRPTLLTIAELIKDIETKEEIIAKMDGKIENLSKSQLLYNQEIRKIQLIDTSVPDTPSPENFARQIEGLSSKHNATTESITIGKTVILGAEAPERKEDSKKDKEEKQTLPGGARPMFFTVKTSTPVDGYNSLLGILTDMENLRSPVKMDSVDLQIVVDRKSTGEEDVRTLELIVSGQLPYFRDISSIKVNQND